MGFSASQQTEVETLTWRQIDDELDDRQFDRLQSLLREHEEARKRYVDCMMLHTQLCDYFDAQAGRKRFAVGKNLFLEQLLDPRVKGPKEPSDNPVVRHDRDDASE